MDPLHIFFSPRGQEETDKKKMQSANNTNISRAAQDKQLLNVLQRLEYVTLEDIHKTRQKCRVMNSINKPTFRPCLQYLAVLDKISLHGCQSSTPK